ncbi:molybdopterin biosynthesis protein [uncultured Cetobacterium sp.]|uniref:molybdopterin biosynthesis protein n=1 Tax=uncultured Cetobacterium sp. TaxID=527638 RepID=UPI002626ECEF|nr:molybdopterin biosynthesis protein [uncultured Cetobacterium sp.]
MENRNVYIDNIDVEKALSIFFKSLEIDLQDEKISVLDSIGRVTSKAVFAKRCSPTYSASAMDGILIFAEKTAEASEVNPIYLKENEDFIFVNTGNPIDYNIGDSVIMIEEVISVGNGLYKIIKSSRPWQHIRPVGEDIIEGEMIIKSNHKIAPQDLGALISAGVLEIFVIKKPKVAIIATGDEVIDIFKEDYKEKSVIDCNSYVFSAQIKEWGGIPEILPKLKDNLSCIKENLSLIIKDFDLILINAGSSAGSKDYTKSVIEDLGEVVVHGVAIKPGKPTILGNVDGKPVIGIPGYPVSAFLAMDIFIKPLMEKLTQISKEDTFVEGVLSKTIVSSLKHKELVRVTLNYSEGKYIVNPLARGAGITTSLSKADGILEIPKEVEGIKGGEVVKIKLLKPLKEIKDYLISVGSHDVIMDLIGDKIKLCSTHTGSFGGVLAIKQKNTHIAPIHILDDESGVYNIPAVKKYFPAEEMVLIKGVKRVQGLMVTKCNPLGIKDISDIISQNLRYVNRQRGSGTRILLDFLLKKESIASETLNGYAREANTHLEVAMAIKSGTSDVGLGIKEAAVIADLDFIPILDEDYDFLVNPKMIDSDKIKEFIAFLKSDYFINKINDLDGYSAINSGEVIVI